MEIKKLRNENNPENIIAHIVFVSSKHPELGEYECVGTLIRDEEDLVRVCFNAKNDQVVDYLDIHRVDIISIDIIDPAQIERLQ